MLLRLVDITLILLFGFISISSIEDRTKIKLPDAENAEIISRIIKTVEIIAITESGKLLIDKEESELPYDLLLPYLLSCRENSDSLKVKIRAEKTVAILHVKMVANLCDSLNIPKSIEVRMQENRSR